MWYSRQRLVYKWSRTRCLQTKFYADINKAVEHSTTKGSMYWHACTCRITYIRTAEMAWPFPRVTFCSNVQTKEHTIYFLQIILTLVSFPPGSSYLGLWCTFHFFFFFMLYNHKYLWENILLTLSIKLFLFHCIVNSIHSIHLVLSLF